MREVVAFKLILYMFVYILILKHIILANIYLYIHFKQPEILFYRFQLFSLYATISHVIHIYFCIVFNYNYNLFRLIITKLQFYHQIIYSKLFQPMRSMGVMLVY